MPSIELNFKDYPLIPEQCQSALTRYINYGITPGQFLISVLSNDLFKAYENGDDDHINALPQLVKFIYNKLPSNSWGSLDKIHNFTSSGFFH